MEHDGIITDNQQISAKDCAERIVLSVDISNSMNSKMFNTRAGLTFSGLEITKKALKLFIANKLAISSPSVKHQFALIFLLNEALWVKDFTSDVDDLYTYIDGIQSLDEHESKFDLTSLFNLLLEKAQPRDVDTQLVRCIMIYGRSNCLPVYSNHEAKNILEGSTNFFMDVVYLHEAPCSENQVQAIYSELCDLEHEQLSHIYEISRTPTKIFDVFSRLLAHPRQRCAQLEPVYKLEPHIHAPTPPPES